MKLKKLLIIFLTFILCGCSFSIDNYENELIYTTFYPIEYSVSNLFSEFANVKSVYPNGAKNDYEVTDKKKNKFALGDTFVYSGLADEAVLAKDLININENIQIIDATKGMNISNNLEELWLDPSNYLMLCSNIKRSLIEYNESNYEAVKTIENNYDTLNEKISSLDVKLYNLGKNGTNDTILTTNSLFKYLTKYNINVISLDSNEETLDKNYNDAKKLIQDKKIEFIYTLEGETLDENEEKLISDYSLVKIEINSLYTLSDEEVESDKDYIVLMNEIIDEFKRELYK